MTTAQIQELLQAQAFPDESADRAFYETHANWILLGRSFAFKIKKPVHFSFMDFSTLEKRHFYCRRELELNQRMEPEIYLDVVPVKIADDRVFIGEAPGTILDYAVKMRRLDRSRQMHLLLAEQAVEPSHIRSIAGKMARFHQSAQLLETAPDWKQLYADFEDIQQVKAPLSQWFGPSCAAFIDQLTEQTYQFLHEHQTDLTRRFQQGFWRDGHGDLHTRNIFLLKEPVVFDCIEFNDHFRQLDILDEIAFLCMDLDFFREYELADLLVETYHEEMGLTINPTDRALFYYYKAYRANVRLKVAALANSARTLPAARRDEMERYLHLLRRYLPVYTGFTDKSQSEA
ncbi:MAG: hypothetical protein KDC44_01645 [Phaeodactylibacter sp.]|nr:hypothetical protein [Phaeodactylibacter sp.]